MYIVYLYTLFQLKFGDDVTACKLSRALYLQTTALLMLDIKVAEFISVLYNPWTTFNAPLLNVK